MNNSDEIKYWFDVESTADKAVEFYTRLAREMLAEDLPDDHRKNLELLMRRFPEAYRLLKKTLGPIGASEPMRLRTIYQMLFSVITASGAIGASLSQTKKVRLMHMAKQLEGAARGGQISGQKRRLKAKEWKKLPGR